VKQLVGVGNAVDERDQNGMFCSCCCCHYWCSWVCCYCVLFVKELESLL